MRKAMTIAIPRLPYKKTLTNLIFGEWKAENKGPINATAVNTAKIISNTNFGVASQ